MPEFQRDSLQEAIYGMMTSYVQIQKRFFRSKIILYFSLLFLFLICLMYIGMMMKNYTGLFVVAGPIIILLSGYLIISSYHSTARVVQRSLSNIRFSARRVAFMKHRQGQALRNFYYE